MGADNPRPPDSNGHADPRRRADPAVGADHAADFHPRSASDLVLSTSDPLLADLRAAARTGDADAVDAPPKAKRAGLGRLVRPPARHTARRSGSMLPRLLALVGIVTGVALVSGASIMGIAAWDIGNQVSTVTLVGEDASAPPPNIAAIEGGVNLLLVGSDSREGQGDEYGDETSNLNDVTMLVHVSQDHSSATVVSFPRDLVVPIPECPDGSGGTNPAMSAQPINVTLFYGGLPCTVVTVEKLTGISIPFAAQLQFTGAIEMSNAVGSVPVCVSSAIEDDYSSTFLGEGSYDLQGQDALQFLRTRHGVGDGSDLARISSQQAFLASLARTIKSEDTLGDLGKLYGIAKAAAGSLSVSQSLKSPDTMVSIALALRDIPLENIGFYTYPGVAGADGVYTGKLKPITADADALFAAIRQDRRVTSTAGNIGLGATVVSGGDSVENGDSAAGGADASADVVADDPAAAGKATGAGALALPSTVTGQTAAEVTCTKGSAG